ncbi:Protein of unknown function DUF4246 [Penicillium italicum]|uniref:Uncharacterized protein n=1 Tax=Penicillium italicum TaxID=40296 RepID=A0A0A2KXX7_PENIT|nr:Protein of unknown function DUF4246 [Penicillium italicum]
MAARSTAWKASQAEKRREARRELRRQRGYDASAHIQKDAERTRGRASAKTTEMYKQRVRKYEEFLVDERNMPKGYKIGEGHPFPTFIVINAETYDQYLVIHPTILGWPLDLRATALFPPLPSTMGTYYPSRRLVALFGDNPIAGMSDRIMPPTFDNSGSGPLKVPGFHGIFLEMELAIDERFAHGTQEDYSRRPVRLTAPEVQMLRLMERITDLKNWEQEIFDPATLAKRAQASEYVHLDPQTDQDIDMELVTTRSWLWCVAELQDKARSLRETGHVVVFNADSGVCKADRVVSEALRQQLQDAFQRLPKSDGTHDLVDPSLYMLIYGQTKVLSRGGRVPLATDGMMCRIIRRARLLRHSNCHTILAGTRGVNSSRLAFSGYPNTQAYSAIEKLISLAIRPWNDVLVKGVRGRMPRRIHTYGVTKNRKLTPMSRQPPKEVLPRGWKEGITQRSWTPEEWEEYCFRVMEFLLYTDEDPKYRVFEPEPDDPPQTENLLDLMTPEMWASPTSVERIIRAKWRRLNCFHYPEPGISFTYEDWKLGKTANPIFGPWESEGQRSKPPRDHEYYQVSLEDQFRAQGLQIIVRVFSIDLTPDAPRYPGEAEFHVDGMLNEHIIATAGYCYSSENLTESRISYQQNDDLTMQDHQEDPNCIYKLYGLSPSPAAGVDPPTPKLQTLGSVAVVTGSYLLWSNTLRYKRHPFSLRDPSRPGHQRWVVLWLGGPHYRICSTRNVPPQQHKWWCDDVLANPTLLSTLPQELVDMIMKETGPWPMSHSEALRHKLKSDKEREEALRIQIEEFPTYGFWDELL